MRSAPDDPDPIQAACGPTVGVATNDGSSRHAIHFCRLCESDDGSATGAGSSLSKGATSGTATADRVGLWTVWPGPSCFWRAFTETLLALAGSVGP